MRKKLTFGKYRGRMLKDVPESYLKWGANKFTDKWKSLFQSELDRRDGLPPRPKLRGKNKRRLKYAKHFNPDIPEDQKKMEFYGLTREDVELAKTGETDHLYKPKNREPQYYDKKRSNHSQRAEVLSGLGFSSYAEYLNSALWRWIKFRVFARRGRLCVICQSGASVIHHSSYFMSDMNGDRLDNLHPLCNGCHTLVEYDDDGAKLSTVQARRKFRDCKRLADRKELWSYNPDFVAEKQLYLEYRNIVGY